jgi:hypothetical protein
VEQSATPSWTDAELAALLAEYFGEKLSPPQLERLTLSVRAALLERSARKDASRKGHN